MQSRDSEGKQSSEAIRMRVSRIAFRSQGTTRRGGLRDRTRALQLNVPRLSERR